MSEGQAVTESVAEFRQSLSELDTPSTVVSPDELESTLEDVVESPPGCRAPVRRPLDRGHDGDARPSPAQLRAAAAGVTGSRMGIASLGTVAVESRGEGDELVGLYPSQYVVVLRASDIWADLAAGFLFAVKRSVQL